MKFSRLALSIALAPSLALAEQPVSHEQALKLSDTLITANRDVEQRSDSSAASTVFTRADIERLQPSTVADLLKRVPGMQIGQSGGRGSVSGIYLRGTKTAQTLVLIDGQRFNGADSGAAALEFLSIDQIERIEVSKGANSATYGADAIGGVIQVFTRRADGEGEGLRPRARLAYGSRGSWERSLGLSGGNADTRFSLNASSEDTNGINRTDVKQGPDADHDAYRNNSISFNLNHRFSEQVEAGLSLLDQRGETEYDLGYLGSYPYDEFELKSYSSFIKAQLNDNWSSQLELGHSERRRFFRADDSSLHDSLSSYRNSIHWLNNLRLSEQHSVTAGAEWYEDTLHSNADYNEDSRWNQAAYIQHAYQGQHVSTELGLRHDKNQQFGSENTWHGALTVPLNTANQLILSYSEGFRAPTFVDLYYPDFCDPTYGCSPQANPDLQPEHSKSYELQWRSQLGNNAHLEASLYRTDIKDAIVLDSFWIPQNIATVRINGFEASLNHHFMGWQSAIGLSIIDPRDRDTGKTLSRRAKRTLSLDIDRQVGQYSFGASWLASSHSFSDENNTQKMSGYGVLGIRTSWQATSDVLLGLKVDNLLDKQYSHAQVADFSTFPAQQRNYMEEGRTGWISVTWTPHF
ncbi:vitamin B12 transporter [Halopseudomonas litoralis]|uniref:Vitamin B12 transporter n=1 Tax=Halopseudomonas litoralis TaxID=797277 RepID=A0A1H1MCX2_9GAMM|nr:TonB-dependent receptor [Halopseudomonas litoralis]SDR84674.1 vitamin B12 transporter [Halopseudomonas litoralis]